VYKLSVLYLAISYFIIAGFFYLQPTPKPVGFFDGRNIPPVSKAAKHKALLRPAARRFGKLFSHSAMAPIARRRT
jgi:hypothetical protein